MQHTTDQHARAALCRLVVAVATLAVVTTAAPALAHGGGSGGGQDFSICCDDSTIPAFLVRGGLATCPAFDSCFPNPSFEPRYSVAASRTAATTTRRWC